MQRVVSINLSGNAYQLDENAYNALFAYLDGAEARLKDNPDRAEIIADLEQAIAEKCRAYLGPHKTVVTAGEIDQIISEMGPVAGQPADAGRDPGAQDSTGSGASEKTRTGSHAHKMLYQIHEGAMISGVCQGLAAFLNVDVTVIRVLFALFAFATSGWGILAYVALMFILPHATTREQAASNVNTPQSWPWDKGWPWDRHGWPWDRHGWPWDRPDRQAQREWKHQQRDAKSSDRQVRMSDRQARLSGGPAPAFPTFTIIISVVLGIFWLSFWTGGFRFNGPFFWGWPFWGFPHWLGILLFFVIVRCLFLPLRMARRGWYGDPGYRPYGPYSHPHTPWLAMWQGILSLAMMLFLVWLTIHYIPEIRDFIERLPSSGAR